MTRRLIMLDLSSSEYKALRQALRVGISEAEWEGNHRAAKHCKKIKQKIDDAWNAKGREGRGYNTKVRISDIDDGIPPSYGDGML